MKKNSVSGSGQKVKGKSKKESGLDSLFCQLTGLTLKEYKRKKELERILAGKGKKSREISTQQTIAFEEVYEDGICKVHDDFYTKMIEFHDVNYVLLDDTERANVLGLYSQCINCFDPSVTCQLFLFNRRVNAKNLETQFDIALQGDSHDDIREEYSEMLKNLSTKGTNGIVKGKYLIFGVEAPNLKEARSRFKGLQSDMVNHFRGIGSNARILNGEDRIKLLHEYYNQNEEEAFDFSYERMEEIGDTQKDQVAPHKMDFRNPGYFKMGNAYGKVRYFDLVAPKISDEVLTSILDLDDTLCVSIHFRTIDTFKAIKMLKHALSEVQKSKINEQKKAVKGGWDMDIVPPDILVYETATKELLDDMNTSNQKLIKTTILLAGFGKTKKEMEIVSQRILGIVQTANCVLTDMSYDQENAMNAVAPIGINDVKLQRNLVTKNLAILVPFNTRELFQTGKSLYYGLNALSNNMIMADRKTLRTPNGIILGTPGSGKSFSAKREILGCFLVTTDDILICDPEGEYYPLVKTLGGEVVKLSTNSTQYLNPMDIQLSHMGDREALKLKSDFIITLCDMIAGRKKGLENDEKGIIDGCIDKIYENYFRDPKPENMPILEDLYNELLRYDPKVAVSEALALDAKQKAIRIANSLLLYVHGSQNYFNHRSNIDAQNRIVCFDIRDLGSQLKELGMLIVQDAVWNRVSLNRERKISTRYYCDEFHLLLREEQTAEYSVEIWKRFRKWGGIPTGLTQNVGDFLQSAKIEGILGNSDFVYLLNQSVNDREIIMDKFNLSEKQMEKVTNSDQGCGLILFNDAVIPFIDKYPTDTKSFKIMNTKPEEVEDKPKETEGAGNGEEQ